MKFSLFYMNHQILKHNINSITKKLNINSIILSFKNEFKMIEKKDLIDIKLYNIDQIILHIYI